MKRQIFKVVSVVTLALLVSFSSAELVVYEGFDYTAGGAINGLNGGTGFDGAWVDTGGTNPALVVAGETFGSLEVSGGAAQRPNRTGADASARTILDSSALTADASTMWFSVLMNPGSNTNAFALNSYATLIFGDTALTGGSGSSAAPIGAGGNAIGVGLAGLAASGQVWDNMEVQGVTYSGGTLTQNTAERITIGDTTAMIVGKVDWAANGTDDVISLYNVSNPAAALPTAFATMAVDLDQSLFNIISIGDAQCAVIDEIRMGTSYADVAPVPEPATMSLLVLGGLGLLRRRRN